MNRDRWKEAARQFRAERDALLQENTEQKRLLRWVLSKLETEAKVEYAINQINTHSVGIA